MHHCRNEEHKILGMLALDSSSGDSDGVLENVEVEELMHDNVPLSVVPSKVFHIPPIFVELSVAKPNEFSKHVHP
jgi:hypothetical protein